MEAIATTHSMIDLRHRSDAARIALLEAERDVLRGEVLQARLILDSATEHAIVTLNLGGRITSWNAGAANLFGYSTEEVIGRSGEMFFTPEDRADGTFITELCLALDHGRAINERWHLCRNGSQFWASGVMVPLRTAAGEASGFLNIFCDRSGEQAKIRRRSLLQDEAQHRLRNTLTIVQALAVQTARQTTSVDTFSQTFSDRIQALARSHDMLGTGTVQDTRLRSVVDDSLAFFGGHTDRIRILGAGVFLLPENAVTMLGLALHELTANAVKHGALSTPAGWVEVSWSQAGLAGANTVELVWRERSGPLAAQPQQVGSGLRLLEHDLTREYGGAVRVSFRPEGLECRIVVPVSSDVRQ